MTKYNVIITTKVQKYLDRLFENIASRLESAMLKLESNPRPNGVEKLTKGCIPDKSLRLQDYLYH